MVITTPLKLSIGFGYWGMDAYFFLLKNQQQKKSSNILKPKLFIP
ncbi:hypothetical protein Q91_0340 [Cycloclasticus sp. P1]|jgi:hypothetical protein|nr:hypothetical protein Q91_0340 [Cycloclasticus sp. P1]